MAIQDVPGRRSSIASRPALGSVRDVLTAVVTTVVPGAATLSNQEWKELEELIDNALRDRPVRLQRQLLLALRALQWLTVLRYGRPFTALDPAERTRVLSYLQDHRVERVRVGFWGLRTLALLGYYGRPEASRAVGYAADRRGWEALA